MRHRPRRPAPLLLLLLGGCAPAMYGGPPAVTDPPWLSPRAQSLDAPPEGTLGEAADGFPDVTTNRPVPEPNARPLVPDRSAAPPSASEGELDGPRIGPLPATVPPRIEIDVEGPERRQEGSAATFRIEVTNAGDRPAESVAVACELDDGLRMPGRTDRAVRNALGRLAVGEKKAIRLTLIADDVGRHCCRFDVTVDDREAVWKQVCLEVVPRVLAVDVVGPRRRTVGSRAEFVISVRNVTDEPLEDVRLVVEHGRPLVAREGSAGAVREPGRLAWDLGVIAGRETVQAQIEFEAGAATDEACVRTRVSASGVPDDERETCLVIEPVTGPLLVTVEDDEDPVAVGDEVELLVSVANRDSKVVGDVATRITVPDGLRVVDAAVERDGEKFDLGFDVRDARLEFRKVDALAAGKRLDYRVRLKALRAGTFAIPATVRAADGEHVVEASEPLVVHAAAP